MTISSAGMPTVDYHGQPYSTVQIREKAVARRLNKRWLFLIANHGQHSRDGCMAAYKEKELLELLNAVPKE